MSRSNLGKSNGQVMAESTLKVLLLNSLPCSGVNDSERCNRIWQ